MIPIFHVSHKVTESPFYTILGLPVQVIYCILEINNSQNFTEINASS